MLIPAVAVLLLALPVALGGSLRRLLSLELRRTGFLPTALLLQVVVLALPDLADDDALRPVLAAGHVASYLMIGAFLLANRSVPGMWLIATGGMSNGLTVAVNGGTLPAAPDAVRRAGLPVTEGFSNSAPLNHPHLAWLGDVFAVPAGWPLANTFSVGDVALWLGIAVLAFRVAGTRWTEPGRGSGVGVSLRIGSRLRRRTRSAGRSPRAPPR